MTRSWSGSPTPTSCCPASRRRPSTTTTAATRTPPPSRTPTRATTKATAAATPSRNPSREQGAAGTGPRADGERGLARLQPQRPGALHAGRAALAGHPEQPERQARQVPELRGLLELRDLVPVERPPARLRA